MAEYLIKITRTQISKKGKESKTISFLGDNLAKVSGSPFLELGCAIAKASCWLNSERILAQSTTGNENAKSSLVHVEWERGGFHFEEKYDVVKIEDIPEI